MRANPFKNCNKGWLLLAGAGFLLFAAPARAQESEALLPSQNPANAEWQSPGDGHYFAKTPYPAFGDSLPSSPEAVNAIAPAAGEAATATPAQKTPPEENTQ